MQAPMLSGATYRSETESRILDAAARLFASNGFNASTTRQIAAEAGMERATLYHYTDSKQELLYQVCLRAIARGAEEIIGAVQREVGPEARIRALFTQHVLSTVGDLDYQRTMLLEMRSLRGKHLAKVVRMRQSYQTFVAAEVREAQKSGYIRSDLDEQTLALALLGLLNWTLIWYQTSGQMSPDQLALALLTVFIEGAEA